MNILMFDETNQYNALIMAALLNGRGLKKAPSNPGEPMHPIDNRMVEINNEAVAKAKGLAPVQPAQPQVGANTNSHRQAPPASRQVIRRRLFKGKPAAPAFKVQDDHNNMQANRVADKKKKAAKKKATQKMKLKARKRG